MRGEASPSKRRAVVLRDLEAVRDELGCTRACITPLLGPADQSRGRVVVKQGDAIHRQRIVLKLNYFCVPFAAILGVLAGMMPMHHYGQYCPVARAAEILADRWTVLIVRELLADVAHFNELERGLPHMSRSLLVERLRRLEQVGVVERRTVKQGKWSEYRLTPAGQDLQRLVDVLGEWGARWAFGDPRPSELDPIVLLWWMRRRVCFDRIPRRRVVMQFEFLG